MGALKIPEGEAIEAKMVTRSIENAQRKVEARNFDIRKQLLEYDDVANDQRKVIYAQRNELLESQDISQTIALDPLRRAAATWCWSTSRRTRVEEQWDIPALERKLETEYFLKAAGGRVGRGRRAPRRREDRRARDRGGRRRRYDGQVRAASTPEVLHHYERAVMLQSIDTHWREHLAALDYLRQGIHLRGYAQKQPKQEYKREAFELFGAMLDSIKREVTRHLMAVQIRSQEQVEEAERARRGSRARA